MLPIETETALVDCIKPCVMDQVIDNDCLCVNDQLNSENMISNAVHQTNGSYSFFEKTVTKFYEISNDIVQESYFDLDDMNDTEKMIADYAKTYPNGVILVKNTHERTPLSQHIALSIKGNLNNVILFGRTADNNLADATKKAYELAGEGQAILFHGVDKNFDLFSYVL